MPSVLIKGNVGAFFTTVSCTLVPSSMLSVCVTQKKKNIKDDEKKSDVVRVHHEKKGHGVRVDHEKKSHGVRVDHEKKSEGVRVYHEKKNDGVRVHHE